MENVKHVADHGDGWHQPFAASSGESRNTNRSAAMNRKPASAI